jgi:hypothetical protein
VLAWVAVVATPAYGLFPNLSVFLAPAALASMGLAFFMKARSARSVAWGSAAILAAWLAENVFSIVRHEIGWAMRQGVEGGDAILAGVVQSASRAPYWLAAALPVALAIVVLRLRR